MIRTHRILLAGLVLCLTAPLFAGEGARVVAVNPSEFPRKSETVEVRLADLLARDSTLLATGSVEVVDGASSEELIVQVTDEDLLFQTDFAPGETKTFLVRARRKPVDAIVSKVDGYFARPREDYAWENDRIAFRMYGPALAAEVKNGIDVWTKRVRGLIVRKWYEEDAKEGKGNYYHTDRGEGADFFAVGKTLGAGGSGIWYKDSLCQPGVFSSYKTLCNGPIRTSFELTYTTWNVGGERFTERKRISLDAGWSLNKVEVLFAGIQRGDSFLVACGLVKRKNATVRLSESGSLVALWGPTNDDPVNVSLGTGIILLPSTVVRKHEDTSHVILLGHLTGGE
ncbi:DUF4861 domain-containing protein, partial [bacterium]